MAVPIELVEAVDASEFAPSTSRYIDSDIILWSENKITTFKTFKRVIPEITDQDLFAVIPPGEEFRPDLTSFRAYNTVDFWWNIMLANSIADVFEYKAGLSIRIPSPFNL